MYIYICIYIVNVDLVFKELAVHVESSYNVLYVHFQVGHTPLLPFTKLAAQDSLTGLLGRPLHVGSCFGDAIENWGAPRWALGVWVVWIWGPSGTMVEGEE